jgi:uncharacterized protein (DUF1499 family)
MRRIIIEEPFSDAAVWSLRVAVFALATATVSVALARLTPSDARSVLTVFGASLTLAFLAILLSASAAIVIWRTGRRGAGRAGGGFVLAVALLAYPAYLTGRAIALPPLADVTTDFEEPPSFMISTKAREARAGVTPPPVDPAHDAIQRQAYPEVVPIFVDLEAPQAYQLSLRVAKDLGWKVVDSTPPNVRGDGVAHIEALDKSLVFGFPTDIAIRVTPLANQTRIDLRCVVRVGKHDFGANARRIRRFILAAQDFGAEEK